MIPPMERRPLYAASRTMIEKKEGSLSRWSRRKRAGGASPAVGAPAEQPAAPPPVDGERTEATSETAGQAPADLPDIETLHKDSDFTVFLKEGVPEELKTLALRKLWRTDPVFAHIDGLDDYDEDFRAILAMGTKILEQAREASSKLVAPKDETAPEGGDADQTAGSSADAVAEAEAAENEVATGRARQEAAEDGAETPPGDRRPAAAARPTAPNAVTGEDETAPATATDETSPAPPSGAPGKAT